MSHIHPQSISVNAVEHVSDLLFPIEFPAFLHWTKRKTVERRYVFVRDMCLDLFEHFPNRLRLVVKVRGDPNNRWLEIN